ncbi:MAG TPA: DUF1302 family protein [Nevskiaceae bacterium]|nr:DUF1302 family protein [Nevskiaceae bacterium]
MHGIHAQGGRVGRSLGRCAVALAAGGLLAPGIGQASTFDYDGFHVDYQLQVGYALGVRMNKPDSRLINGPVDQFQSTLLPAPPAAGPGGGSGGGAGVGGGLFNLLNGLTGGATSGLTGTLGGILNNLTPGLAGALGVGNTAGQVFSFTHTGLPTTINYDDGDRDFGRYALINNRLSGYGQIHVTWRNYGLFVSGAGFYDQAYHGPNDNNSNVVNRGILANTVNEVGPGGITSASDFDYPGPYNRFTQQTRYYDGQRVRWLESYVYGDWNIGSTSLDLRLGRQLVAWGQSLFFGGLALQQSRADATMSNVPGANVKSILLPTQQIALRFNATRNVTLMGYYKLEFAKTELFPEGDYFSPADVIGPGSTFVYGSANPLAGGGSCSGLISNLHIGTTSTPANLDSTVCGLLGSLTGVTNAPPFIITPRGPDIDPSRWGQYGLGIEYQLTPITSVAFHYIRYDDNNPAVQLNVGYAPIGVVAGKTITTQIINQPVPVSYNIRYFGGIHMYNLSYSTVLGPFNVGGEFNYRDGAALPVESVISGVVSPVYTRGKISQALMSAIYVVNPNFYFDDFVFTGEVGYTHVNSLDRVPDSFGIQTSGPVDLGDGRNFNLGDGRTPFYGSNAWGFEFLMIPTKHNLFDGWDMSTPVSFSMLVKGNPELAGSFGALYGQGDQRLGLGVSFQYLQNLTLALGYNLFFGNANELIGHSLMHANPFVDRNYATFTVKYHIF